MTKLLNVRLSDVARAAGLSIGGTSYALRGHPCIPASTVERVRRIANEIGYRPDLRVSSVMAAIRRGRPIAAREALALIWVNFLDRLEEEPLYFQYYAKVVLESIRVRAEQHGAVIEEFRMGERGLSPSRLNAILRARAISGVIILPTPNNRKVEINWDWQTLAPVIIGNTEISPVTNRVAHYHFRSVWQVLQRLRDEGLSRPAAILSEDVQERIHRMQHAAFVANHPSPAIAQDAVRYGDPENIGSLRAWLKKFHPDALVLGWQVDRRTLKQLRELAPKAKRIVTLDWHPHGVLPGVDLSADTIAANAVDLVIAQLHRNERGIVSHPTTILLDGVWRESCN